MGTDIIFRLNSNFVCSTVILKNEPSSSALNQCSLSENSRSAIRVPICRKQKWAAQKRAAHFILLFGIQGAEVGGWFALKYQYQLRPHPRILPRLR
jgi:hypothetical protein